MPFFSLTSFRWPFFMEILALCFLWILILEFNNHFSREKDFERIVRKRILGDRIL